ncbi:MAG: methylmalonyl-CoA epimerase [Candidatus Cloacimonetes bacterium]|nr:methylmalonyl-CoA epimerase [Candidatus Cloacimonadota bacterium]
MLEKVNHIGIAVRDLEKSIEFYRTLGLELEAIEEVRSQKVRVAFFPIGEVRIELLEATSEHSPIAKFIEKKGEGIHHLAFGTNNIQSRLFEIEQKGIRLIDKIPRKGAHNSNIAFLHPKSTNGVLIELCEEHK